MWVRIPVDRSSVKRQAAAGARKPPRRFSPQPGLELLEDRQLLAATLQGISNQTVPSKQGLTIPLLATTGQTTPQTFTVTSSNPDIAASIIGGNTFWTLGISYTDPVTPANSFSGNLTFQLFPGQTPNTVTRISNFTTDDYYVNTGKYFPRIVTNFDGTGNAIVQGGSDSATSTSSSSGVPPIGNEVLQQLAFTGSGQLAMANTGEPDSNDAQFFITTGEINSGLSYGYTIFGQLLTGTTTLGQMAAVQLATGQTYPVNPLTITSATISSSNPNGTLLIDTTQAQPGETSTIVVTAHEGTSTISESFVVTVGTYGGPTTMLPINFRPFALPTTGSTAENTPGQVQLNGQTGSPDPSNPGTLSYSLLSQPAHGTISDFDASTGTFTYTPVKGFLGTDTLSYQVTATGPASTPATTVSNPGTVTIVVGAGQTGAVQVIGTALVVQPLPTYHGKNVIHIAQLPDASADGGAVLQVSVNGVLDSTQPGISDINRIIVYGGRTARNQIVVDPSVQVATTIASGHGKRAFLTGGGGPTREHGWFGHTLLIGGPGQNELIGLAGHVKFKPSKATTLIFASQPKSRTPLLNPRPPGGTYYRYVHGHLVPIPQSDVKEGRTRAN